MKELLAPHGVLGAALSLSVTTIGAGVLAIPAAFQDAGVIAVLLVFAIIGVLTVISIDYLILCVDALGLRSYEDISRELLGRGFEEAVRWILIVYLDGIAAGYIVVIEEILTPVLPLVQTVFPFLSTPKHVILFFWCFVMLPLACLPTVSHLRHASFLAIGATVFVSFAVVYRYFDPVDEKARKRRDTADVKYLSFSYKGLLALPVLMFSFDCQALVFQLYTTLRPRTRKTMLAVATVSVLITGLAYASVGFFGYISNSPYVDGNILSNYRPLKDHLFGLAEVCYSITIVIAYVLVLFPCRDAVFILLFGYNSATHELSNAAITYKQHLVTTVILATISLVVALEASGLVFVIALLGGLCSSTVCFTYPAAFRLMLHSRGIVRGTKKEITVAVGMLVFGIVGGVFGTAVAFTL